MYNLQNIEQTQRIQQMLRKKMAAQQKVSRIVEQQIDYRQKLDNKIKVEQNKHEKKRLQFIEKRVKGQHFKTKYVDEIHQKYSEMKTDRQRNYRSEFGKNKQAMNQFWDKRRQLTVHLMKVQRNAKPLFNDAVKLKKQFEAQSQDYSLTIKQKLLQKHRDVKNRIQNIVKNKQQQVHNVHNQQIDQNLKKHEQILQGKKGKYINSICLHRANSQHLLKQSHKIYTKKLQNRHIDNFDKRQNIKSAYSNRNKEKASSLATCRCWKKGLSTRNLLSKSSQMKYQQIQQKQYRNHSPNKTQQQIYYSSNPLLYSRSMFLSKSRHNRDKVKAQQQILREKQLMKNQMKLMCENQISSAIKLRDDIRNQSNCLLRQSKVVQVV